MNDMVEQQTAFPGTQPINLLEARCNFKIFGADEVFIDRKDARLIEISPESAAAKLIVDLAMLGRRLPRRQRDALFERRNLIVDPLRKLISPLISGKTPWIKDTATPENMFFGMLAWVDPDQVQNHTVSAGRRVFVGGCHLELDIPALAAFLTLDVLLDGADIRQTMAQNVKLNMPQMFRCLCHLLSVPSVWADCRVQGKPDETSARRKILADCLQRLQADNITRNSPDSFPAGALH
jgi:hypothetical protein